MPGIHIDIVIYSQSYRIVIVIVNNRINDNISNDDYSFVYNHNNVIPIT